MLRNSSYRRVGQAVLLNAALLVTTGITSRSQETPQVAGVRVATGQRVTPLAAPGSTVQKLHTDLRSDDNANGANAVTTALSPDGSTLLILTSGFNTSFNKEDGTPIVYPVLDPATGQPTSQTTSNAEWVFVYDVSGPAPVQKQKFNLPHTYNGLAWDSCGTRFYVSGGADDMVYPFRLVNGSFQLDAPFIVLHTGGQLDNTPAGPQMHAFGLAPGPVVAGVAVSPDGSTLYTANFENDSVSIVDTQTRQVTGHVAFSSPGGSKRAGEYPFWIVPRPGKNKTADKIFVSSQRDGQVVVFDHSGNFRSITAGSEPNKMVLSKDGSRLYVANGDSDSVSVIDSDKELVVATISLQRPGYVYKGANPNSLALSIDEKRLFVSLGGENAVAVVDLASGRVRGRIPTGWYPNSVTVSADGKKLYVVNAKSMPGPNPAGNGGAGPNPTFKNEYIYALQKASLMVIPIPDSKNLQELSAIVDANNSFVRRQDDPTMAALRGKINTSSTSSRRIVPTIRC